VKHAWHCLLRDVSPLKRMDWLLRNMAHVLKSWSDQFVGSIKIQLEIAKEVVLHLETSRDRRQLAPHVESLHRQLKLKPPGLASLQWNIARQESRLALVMRGRSSSTFMPTRVCRNATSDRWCMMAVPCLRRSPKPTQPSPSSMTFLGRPLTFEHGRS
jgi:hypothetical protein